jgi:hypothetical protein
MRGILALSVCTFFLACDSPQPQAPPNSGAANFADPSQEAEVSTKVISGNKPQAVSTPPLPNELTFAGEVIPLDRDDVREGLENELLVNTFRHSRTLGIIKSLNRWRPLIEETLKNYQVPTDFLYLAVAESEFDNNAASYAGAVGMWQFMEGTGKDLGLEVDKDVDMRRDPVLATQAACNYLKNAYENLQSWTLVAAAYNRGVRGINDALEEQKVDNFFDLHLNSETARYLYRILAFKLILENPEAYGYYVKPEEYYQPYVFFTDSVRSDIDNLVTYAKEHNTTYKELRILNPWFNNTSNYKLRVPRNTTYAIRLPKQPADSLLSQR